MIFLGDRVFAPGNTGGDGVWAVSSSLNGADEE
jgi:hypothetical protein